MKSYDCRAVSCTHSTGKEGIATTHYFMQVRTPSWQLLCQQGAGLHTSKQEIPLEYLHNSSCVEWWSMFYLYHSWKKKSILVLIFYLNYLNVREVVLSVPCMFTIALCSVIEKVFIIFKIPISFRVVYKGPYLRFRCNRGDM